MDQKNGNFLSAIFLCMIVLLGWQYFVVEPKLAAERARQAELQKLETEQNGLRNDASDVVAPTVNSLGFGLSGDSGNGALNDQQSVYSIDKEFANTPRLKIQTPELSGSIALMGARFDDIELINFPTSLEENAPAVRLLEHATLGDNNIWQASYGWNSADGNADNMPNNTTLWVIEKGSVLTPETPVTLKYEAPNGLIFRQNISVDAHYMFTITQSVENTSEAAFNLFPYGRITRLGAVPDAPIFVLHEGGIGIFGAEHGSEEISYGDLREDPAFDMTTTGGWLGLTDKYWATALIPPQSEVFRGRLTGSQNAKGEAYKALYSLAPKQLAPGGQIETTGRLFAGAKQVKLIDNYNNQDIMKFDLMIDWGWFYFLTKPMFKLLALFYDIFGNYGLSILIVTILIKLVFFPLANKSYVTMAKMKKLQPEMMRIRDVYADDKMQQQQEMMKLYREEQLNPLAGCLPILIQIPVFFSIYKVLFVTIDMRHQPFFGWINDLSAPDPTSLFNLFGVIPWDPPQFLIIGIWPIIMGLTMFVQMQMNPPAPDPVQRRVFQLMPIMFTFLLASFPAGLVIYWAWNNFLSLLQQGVIMSRHGASIELLPNLCFGKNKKSGGDDAGSGNKSS